MLSLLKPISFLLFLFILTSCSSSDQSPFRSASGTGSGGTSTSSLSSDTGVAIGFSNLTNESHFLLEDSIAQQNSIRMSDDGNTIVFISSVNITGANFDQLNQVFSIVGGVVSQVTNFSSATGGLTGVSSSLINVDFGLSGDGSTIVWIAKNDPLTTNADLTSDIFVSNLAGTVTQLTNEPAESIMNNIDISNDGSLISFSAIGEVAGLNIGGGLQIFTVTNPGGAGVVNLVTSTNGIIINTMRMSGDASMIAFTSTSDWVGGSPNAQSEHVFTINTNGAALTRQTSATASHRSVRISNDGSVLAFNSTGDLVGSNSNGDEELFTLTTVDQTITQQTFDRSIPFAGTAGNDFYDLSGDGTKLIYAHGDGSVNQLSVRSVDVASSVTTTLLEAPFSRGSSEYFNIPFTNIDGTKTVFASNYLFPALSLSEDSLQIYTLL